MKLRRECMPISKDGETEKIMETGQTILYKSGRYIRIEKS